MSGKRKATGQGGGGKKTKAGQSAGFQQPTISQFFVPQSVARSFSQTREASNQQTDTENLSKREKISDVGARSGWTASYSLPDALATSPLEQTQREAANVAECQGTDVTERPFPFQNRPRSALETFRYHKRKFAGPMHGNGDVIIPTTNPSLRYLNSAKEESTDLRNRFLKKFVIAKECNKHAESETGHGGPKAVIEEHPGEDYHGMDESLEMSHGGSATEDTTSRSTKRKKCQYTPLEQQFLEIKHKNPDLLLIVEVGYKYRFFDEDALTAAKELNIVAYRDHAMYTASIPTHRLHVHVRKLIQRGHKVGVVRQMETAALKAVGNNKSGPFVRRLTSVYTKATMVDDLGANEEEFKSSYILCISEEEPKGSYDKIQFSLVAVQLHTGDVVFDEFEDSLMRSALETRLAHLQPAEILLSAKATHDVTEKLIRRLTGSSKREDIVRIERSDIFFLDHGAARKRLAEFYEHSVQESSEGMRAEIAAVYSQALSLPRRVIVCLAALLGHLSQFGLESVLKLTKFFSPFVCGSHMVLNAETLNSLEVYRNETTHEEKGSLMWLLNHTKTKFGQRLLKKWIGQPLTSLAELQKRLDAVEEVTTADANDNALLKRLKGAICQLPDLERSILRIHYGKSLPSELHLTLIALQKLVSAIDVNVDFHSPLLRAVLATLPPIKTEVAHYLDSINVESASNNDKQDLFKDTSRWPDIEKYKENVKIIEEELQSHLLGLRKDLRKPNLIYTTVAGVEYLLEMPVTQTAKIPKDWVKMSNTKSVARFHSPFIIEKIKERDRNKEMLQIVCEAAYRNFLSEIAQRYDVFRDAVQSIATLDCLLSLATVATQPGYCKPRFVEGEAVTIVKDGRHPIADSLVPSFVPNDIDLNDRRCLLITGPNMGGKSSYIRQIALIVIMAQIGSYVPAKSAQMGVFDAVYCRMGAADNLATGQSTFMKEVQETSDIMRLATPRSLVILDELGRGTSTHDGTAIAYATLHYLLETVKCKTLFVTHYPLLGALEDEFKGVMRNCHMAFHEVQDGGEVIIFLYKLSDGLAPRSYGLNVARLAHLPPSVLKSARMKAAEMQRLVKRRQIDGWEAAECTADACCLRMRRRDLFGKLWTSKISLDDLMIL